MTEAEIREFFETHPSLFYKVWATARPDYYDVAVYRFPGISFTGYFVESAGQIETFLSWLSIERIEVW